MHSIASFPQDTADRNAWVEAINAAAAGMREAIELEQLKAAQADAHERTHGAHGSVWQKEAPTAAVSANRRSQILTALVPGLP